jgi:cytochrome c-type biogenesis protein CcmE
MVLKRIVIFRLLFYGTLILTVGTYLQANKQTENSLSITPSYFIIHSTLPGQRFKLSGVIKQGSIQMKKGTLENKFTLTDFKNDISVLYKGALPPTFREGDMASIGGFLADHKNPTCFIGTNVQANHEISPDRWLGESNIDRVTSLNMIETEEDFEYTKMK